MTILDPLEVLGHYLGTILQSSGSRMHADGPWKVPIWIFNDDGKRFQVVDVVLSQGEASDEGGFGGKQVRDLRDGFHFGSLFGGVFLMCSQIVFFLVLGPILSAFW